MGWVAGRAAAEEAAAPGVGDGAVSGGAERLQPGREPAVAALPHSPWSPAEDQVARLRRFEAEHPDARIAFARDGWTWTGAITASGEDHTVRAHELGDVLDALDQMTQTHKAGQ